MLLLYIILFSLIDGLAGVLGAALVVFKLGKNKKTINHLVTFAAGVMFAAAFLDMLPEAIEHYDDAHYVLQLGLVGIIIFYLLEKFFVWSHCHGEECDTHRVAAPLIMIGDTVHNFIDGAAVAAAFLVSVPLGIATAVAVFFHEIPQEMGDIGALLYFGFSKKKAMIYNVASEVIGVLGAVLIYILGTRFDFNASAVLAVAAGGFIYIAGADLLPESHRGLNRHNLITHTLIFMAGILIFWTLGEFFIHSHG